MAQAQAPADTAPNDPKQMADPDHEPKVLPHYDSVDGDIGGVGSATIDGSKVRASNNMSTNDSNAYNREVVKHQRGVK